MIIKEITSQKITCVLSLDELNKLREAEHRLRPNYRGYRYLNQVLGYLSGGYCLYTVQKFIWRAVFGNEKEYCDCVSQ